MTSAHAAEWGQSGKGGDGGRSQKDQKDGRPGTPSRDGKGGQGGAAGGGQLGGAGGNAGGNSLPASGTIAGGAGNVGNPQSGCYDCINRGGGGGGGGGAGLALQNQSGESSATVTGGAGGAGANTWGSLGGGGNGGAGGAGLDQSGGQYTNKSTITGGLGGAGGIANPQAETQKCGTIDCFGGTGGAGGAGAVVHDGGQLINEKAILGGDGGKGGTLVGHKNGGDGGDGGNGVELGSKSILNNRGAVTGGKGGQARSSNGVSVPGGTDGDAGIGVYVKGDDAKIINETKGVISAGGTSPSQGQAVRIEGNNNLFEMWKGSTTNGSVEAVGQNNGIGLGGTEDQDFDLSKIGTEYKGFNRLEKNGSSIATVTGKGTYTGETTINEGELKLSQDGNLESSSGVKNNSRFDISTIDGDSTKIQSLSGNNAGAVVNLGGKELIITNGSGTYAGTLVGDENSGFVVDTGHETLTGDNSGFKGNTTVNPGGELTIDQKLGGTTEIKENGILSGNGTLENLINGGKLVVGSENGFATKTINGNYIGKGGTVVFNTQLGDDNSPTDRLDIRGNTSGQTNVKVNNRNGLGAQTVTGIRLISVGGQSNGTFDLKGDYQINGQDVIVGGAYAYRLRKGGEGGKPSDFYLTSQLKDKPLPPPPPPPCEETGTCPPPPPPPPPPCEETGTCPPNPNPNPNPNPGPNPNPEHVYAATVPLYTAYTQALRTFNAPTSLQERVGNRYWTGASARQIAQGDGPGAGEVVPEPGVTTALTDYGLFWSKVSGSYGRLAPSDSSTGNTANVDTWTFTAGVDNQLYENEAGRFIGGVWFEYGRINTRVSSPYGDGEIKANGYGGGVSLTWYGDNGFYVDGQGKFTWYKNDMDSDLIERTIADGAKGFGYAVSLETGKRIAINEHWSWTPQAQLAWSSLRMDDLTDVFNVTSNFGRQNDLIARLGISANHANSWQGADGYTRRTSFYTGANLYQSLVQDDSNVAISVSGRPDWVSAIVDPGTTGKTWLGIGAGGTYSWHEDKYSIFGNINAASSTRKFGDSYTLSGNVGFSVKW
ncbi:hypothetical protein AVM02_09020 [Brucella anthropi]|uniref:autotransporter family protein n=1 Tax=Brucella anthropi TaxID=529 RepID=UPI003985955D